MNFSLSIDILNNFNNHIANHVREASNDQTIDTNSQETIEKATLSKNSSILESHNNGQKPFTRILSPQLNLLGEIALCLSPQDQYALSLTCKGNYRDLNSKRVVQQLYPNPKPPTMVNLNTPDSKFLEHFKKIEHTLKGQKETQPTNTKLKLKPVDLQKDLSLNQCLQLKAARKASLVILISQYKTFLLPKEIQTICNNIDSLADHEIESLEKYAAARDTLVIWEKIAKQLNLNNPISVTDYTTSLRHISDKAKEFKSWQQQNQSSFKELQVLDLSSMQLLNIDAIKDLTQLTSLILHENQIQDITPLAGLTNLTSLRLEYNQIQDLGPLANLTQLTCLRLQFNQIQNITPLAKLTQLTKLFLSNNQITDLTPLADLIQLIELSLAMNQIQDLKPLAKLTKLTKLLIYNSQITDLTPLAGLTQLIELFLSNNQIKDLTPLAGLTQLTNLDALRNQIRDLSPLVGLINLLELHLSKNRIQDISPINDLNLTFLNVMENPIAPQKILQYKTTHPTVELLD